jgi:uncharacterized membrane protein
MEVLLIILVVIGIPGVALSGLIVAIVALVREKRLVARIDEFERGGVGIDPGHPLARRLRDLQMRVEELEAAGPPAAAAGGPIAEPEVEAAEPAPPPDVAAAMSAPPEPTPALPVPEEPPDQRPAPEPPVPEPEPVAVSPSESEPPSSPPPVEPRTTIDWERWIGVRGAAAAGGVVLALASLLFFQYSIEHGLISPTMRVVFGVIAGIVCLVGSEWLVKRDQSAAANALAGAGVVILYGATWAAQNLYDLIGTLPAFVLMVLITAVCVALAVSRNALFIAVLGLVGGFATPVLVASDVSSPAALFGYILLLDLGLLWLARVRDWPLLSILSLIGTAVHQALWIFTSMDAERALTGVIVLGVFGLAFLFFTGDERHASKLVRATRAGGVAIPFAFALHFAATAELAENPWPLGVLLLVLSAGACWLERTGGQSGAAVVAAAADLAIVGLWFLSHRVSPALAWQLVALCLAMAGLFSAAAEFWRDQDGSRGFGLAALVSALGFAVMLTLAIPRCDEFRVWPWVAAWVVLGGLLVLHSRRPSRAWVQVAAGVAPALGLTIALDEHGRDVDAPEPWLWLALIAGFAVAFQVLAVLVPDGKRLAWAERTAAVTAMAMMTAVASLATVHSNEVITVLVSILVLGVLAALAATRMRSGPWMLGATVATAFSQTVAPVDAVSREAPGSAFAVLALSAVLFTVWPALFPAAFRGSRAGWWGGALAGPFWFLSLYVTYERQFGDETIGLLPVGLAIVALATALWVRPRLSDDDVGRRTMIVWYLAVVVSLVSVAIPLQLENEWITIGWALNGLAILGLWVRLDHPGLKYFGLALLGAATVRLVANPWVLSYHARAATPVVNWLAYTYLVPAAALIWSYLLLRSREVDRLTPLETRLYPVEKPIWASCCGLGAVVVVFAWINLAIADFFASGSELVLSFERMPARDATTSVAWALYALVLLAIGVRSKSSALRWLSLGILVLTLGKVFLHDLGELEDLYRVASLVGLAGSLIVVSLIYQRFVFRTDPEDET